MKRYSTQTRQSSMLPYRQFSRFYTCVHRVFLRQLYYNTQSLFYTTTSCNYLYFFKRTIRVGSYRNQNKYSAPRFTMIASSWTIMES